MADDAQMAPLITALDEVTLAYREAGKTTGRLWRYEADLTAYQLMELAWVHVNTVSHIAATPTPGHALLPAWVLLRSTFEVSLTALWLAREDDWKEREARWLGWIAGEEEFQAKVAADIEAATANPALQWRDHIAALKQRREAIMRLLPKDSRIRRPSLKDLLRECGIEQKYYLAYRYGSQFAHGGPTALSEAFEQRGNGEATSMHLRIDANRWREPLKMASWCIAHCGGTVLGRCGAPADAIHPLVVAHERLLQCCS